MNRYLVSLEIGGRRQSLHVDASSISAAVRKALVGFERRDRVMVAASLLQKNIVRPRIEKHSHGGAFAVGAR